MATPPGLKRPRGGEPQGRKEEEGPLTVRISDSGRSRTPTRAPAVTDAPPSQALSERPTVAPSFDINELARTSAGSKRPSELGRKESSEFVIAGAVTEETYVSQLGSLERVPMLRMSPNELRSLALEPAAGFLMANMDGVSTVEMLLDLGAMPRIEALRIVCQLVRDGVIELA